MSTEISSIEQLVRAVRELDIEKKSVWWFRGHASADWDLLPAVRRGYSRKRERYLSNRFYVRARTRHHSCPGNSDYSGWLALMQHYGLPTRLLDWSRSPLVAAFFATEPHHHRNGDVMETDACIWALAPQVLNRRQGFESLLYPLNANQLKPLIRPALKGNDKTKRIVAAMAVENDSRMQVQQGAFTVHASKNALNKIDGHGEWLRQFVIPKSSAKEFAHELELMGLRIGDLFPDLGNLAKDTIHQHPPRYTET